jgi:hypothetical protein
LSTTNPTPKDVGSRRSLHSETAATNMAGAYRHTISVNSV